MSNADVILHAITHSTGLTDAELVRRTGVQPHQQVNQICHRLEARGLIERKPGPAGLIVNYRAATAGPQLWAQPTLSRPRSPTVRSRPDDDALGSVVQLDLGTTLLVIPCSASKQSGGTAQRGIGLCDVLPREQADALRSARLAVRDRAGIDEHHLMPAWRRYSGAFFEAAGAELGRAVASGTHIIILSGGYGAVLADEPIGMYDARFQVSWWPRNVVADSIAAYAVVRGLRTIAAFVAASTDYAKVVRTISASKYGLDDVYLVSPEMGGQGGAQRIVPRALGEATVSFLRSKLRAGRTSSDGIPLHAFAIA